MNLDFVDKDSLCTVCEGMEKYYKVFKQFNEIKNDDKQRFLESLYRDNLVIQMIILSALHSSEGVKT